jgi:hypothetical protein
MTLEARLVQAHVELEVTPKDQHGVKSVPLVRYGAYEVRLVEFAQSTRTNPFVFWLELFDFNEKASIDSAGADELDDALTVAQELASRAEQLSKNG